jgi:hypothetical protein
VTGFGFFEVAEREARIGRNPQTGETMQIKALKTPKFKAGKTLKDAVAYSRSAWLIRSFQREKASRTVRSLRLS